MWLNLILSFSGSFLLGVTLIHILPELYEHQKSNLTVSIFIMVGFLVQVVLESYSKGIEHGHVHVHDFKKTPYSLFFALCTHAIIEGSILVTPYSTELVSAILIHKIPVAFLLGVLLFSNSQKNIFSIILLIAFAICTPLGSFIGDRIHTINLFNVEMASLLMALATGSFLHVSTTILFESSPGHKLKVNKYLPALIGGMLAIMSSFIHFH